MTGRILELVPAKLGQKIYSLNSRGVRIDGGACGGYWEWSLRQMKDGFG